MLELVDLHRRFGDVVALDGVSFTVEPGQMVGFVGRNGAGKTTTMRIALGLTEPDRGEVRWKGATVGFDDRRRHFGYMPEERGLYPKMRVAEHLRYLGQLHGLPATAAADAAAGWLERLELTDRARSTVDELSLGNQQRVQLIAALLHQPEVLVLDEPFSGLDPVGVDVLAQALAEQVTAGAAVVFSSHQLELVERVCDSVVIIDAGRLVAQGPIAELRASRAPRRVEVEVEVEVDGAGRGDGSWAHAVPGVRAVTRQNHHILIDLADDADDQRVLDAARAVGAVRHFSRSLPTLAELYREVVQG